MRRQEIEIEEKLKQHWYQEALESSQAIKNSDALYIQKRKDNIALMERVKQLEDHDQSTSKQNADRSVDQSATPLADRSSEQSVKEKAEFARMKEQIENYETVVADMAAQAEVARQKYAHRLSEPQKEPPVVQSFWTDQDIKDGEEAERLCLHHVTQRNEDDRRQMEERCRDNNVRRAERRSFWTGCRNSTTRHRYKITKCVGRLWR